MSRKIEEKLAIERHRQEGCILLFLEGGFYRAYEHSALDVMGTRGLVHLPHGFTGATAAVIGEILINLKNKNRNAPLAHDAKCLLRAIDAVTV